MRRILIPIIGLFCIMYACTNDLTTIGQEIIGNDSYIGEMSIPVTRTATIKADSFETSSGLYGTSYINSLVMGRYKDEYSGVTEATPCFQIAPGNIPSLPDNAILDSVTFNFTYAGDIWGDTLYDVQLQKYKLYQLKELPEINENYKLSFFYNTKKVNIEETPIATTEFFPFVENINYAYFKIDKALGDTLFEKMRYRSDEKDDIYHYSSGNVPYYNFLHYFKGLAIVADPTNNCLMTIHASDSLYLQFHYSVAGEEYSIKFPLSQREYQYNRIVNTPTDTLISLVGNLENEVFFEDVQFALTQGMCGYMTKITLPEAPAYGNYTTIIKAQLEIKPEFMNYNPITPPQYITVYTTNDINELTGYLTNAGTAIVGELVKDEIDSDKNLYIFDMTDYYQNISNTHPAEKQQILLSIANDGFSSTGVSFDQMVVREVPILRVYYAKYK